MLTGYCPQKALKDLFPMLQRDTEDAVNIHHAELQVIANRV